MKINYKEVLRYQKFWRESKCLMDKQKEGYIILSNKLIEKAKENNDEIDNVTLLYPEDYSGDYEIFQEFASAFGAGAYIRHEGGMKICSFGIHY